MAPHVLIVGLTWVFWSGVITGIGVFAILLVRREHVDVSRRTLRLALWLGLYVVTVVTAAWHLIRPTGGIWGLILTCGFVLVAGAGWFRGIRLLHHANFRRPLRWWATLMLVLLFTWCLITAWSLATPSNYDTGLYHLGAIQYARDFSIIPGLANLHERFGFNSTMWPLAGLFSSGMWFDDGFRVVNGVIFTLVIAELALRLPARAGASRRPGLLALSVSVVVIAGVIAQYPGRLIASSAQDLASLMLTVIAVAYLLDFFTSKHQPLTIGLAAFLAALLSALMRPLGWVMCIGIFIVVIAYMVRHQGSRQVWQGTALMAGLAGLAAVVTAFRDVFLSGWVLFPSSLFPVDVPWRVPDPSGAARDISGWARTPFQDVDITLSDDTWVIGWLQRLPTDWSVPTLVALLLCSLALLFRQRNLIRSLKVIGWSLIPTVVTLAVWFVTAPDPRFAWGAILAVGLAPFSVALGGAHLDIRVTASFLPITLVAGLIGLLGLAALRGSWAELSVSPQPPAKPSVQSSSLADGTMVLVPSPTDQCWAVYPLCRPSYSNSDIILRGKELAEGFEPATSSR